MRIMGDFHILPLRKCRKFIGNIGERLVYQYFTGFKNIDVLELFYQRRGAGDFGLFKSEFLNEYLKKVEYPDGIVTSLHWKQFEINYPDYVKELAEFENEFVCKIDVKTSLGKFPRRSNILTPSQKREPLYDYILRVKLLDKIENGFFCELDHEDLIQILKDDKLNIDINKVNNIVKGNIPEFKDIFEDIGLYILKDYYFSKDKYAEIMQDILNKYLVVYSNKEVKRREMELSVGLSYVKSDIGWLPQAHRIPKEYLRKCKNEKEAKKIAKKDDMLNLGCFILMNKEEWEPEIIKLYEGEPYYVWDFKKQKQDYDDFKAIHVSILDIKITINEHIITDYQRSQMFTAKNHIAISDDLKQGFKGIITS